MDVVTTPVVLSGGSGTRLWPLSMPHRPKQLQALVGEETMIQATVRRASVHPGATGPVVVCNDQQVVEIARQLEEMDASPQALVVEPVARNTAPAVAAAALLLDPEVVMTVFPADHVIEDTDAFARALAMAVDGAAAGYLVTFGVVPTRPETGFGYIEVGDGSGDISELRRFVEKPDPATAVHLVEAGYLWNSGMFAFTAGDILEELERWEPELLESVRAATDSARRANGQVHLSNDFARASTISLDYAVMERTDRGRVVSLDAGWSDVGSWQSLWEVLDPSGGSVTVGEVHLVDAERSYVRSESRPVAVIGVDDVVVVETPDAVLVVDRRRAQEVRDAAEWFGRRSRESG